MIRILLLLLTLIAVPAAAADIPVLDQDGTPRQFFADLVQGRTVAVEFFYTTCTSFCRPLSANLRAVQERLQARMGKDLALISISIDPATDTPARLKDFAAKMEAGPGWSFVTGARPDIAHLVERLGQSLGNPEDHAPLVLIHNDAKPGWSVVEGYDPDEIAQALLAAAGPAPVDPQAAARAYIGDPLLVTQSGKPVHLFDDVIAGKLVLINFMLTGCQSICPPETTNLARVQDLLGDRLGRSVAMISLTVDPEHDHPAELEKFAESFGARPGWYFLTGDPEVMAGLTRRLGGYTGDPLDHSGVLIAANPASGTWIKLFGLDDPADIARRVLALAEPATH